MPKQRAKPLTHGTRPDFLGWLLDFAQRREVTTLETRALVSEVAEFSGHIELATRIHSRRGRAIFYGTDGITFAGEALKVHPPAVIRKMHRIATEALDILKDRREWQFNGPSTHQVAFTRDGTPVHSYLGRAIEVFRARVADVLVAGFSRIRWCPRKACGRAFVRVRKQKYCSPGCEAIARQQRFYQKHGRDYRKERARRLLNKGYPPKVAKRRLRRSADSATR